VRARQLGNSARCLAMLERDMDQAVAMYDAALELCIETKQRVVSVEWAGALLNAFVGRVDDAVKGFEAVLELARQEGDRWTEYECLRGLVQLEVEGSVTHGAGDLSALLDVARKMGDASTVSVARALEALLGLTRGEASVADALEQAILELREVDAKGMLAYTLTIAAEADLAARRFDQARTRAEEALACASAVGRRTQTALASAILARIALERGDPGAARAHFDAALRDVAEPNSVNARARAAVSKLEPAFNP
jgi:tetratricopeptide (TPR) repeat protein